MASTFCSCRTSALHTFVRSVAQVHLPHDCLARARPWHETRRHVHRQGMARWPAVASLPYRPARTAATAARSPAAEVAEGPQQPSDAARADPAALHDLVAEEERLLGASRPAMGAKEKRSRPAGAAQPKEAKPAYTASRKRQGAPHTYGDQVTDALEEVEAITVEEIEAEQREREQNRLRMRAERAAAKEQARQEWQRQKEQDRRQREKERLRARPDWAAQKAALKEKFPEGWRPRKKLSPDALDGIRALHQQFPDTYTTRVLSKKFEVSPEAIRRILRSKWEATFEEDEERERRWHNRGVNIWQHYAAIGKKPPVKWREAGVVGRARGQRDRTREPESLDGPDGSVRDQESVDVEQQRRLKRQQKLAKHLL